MARRHPILRGLLILGAVSLALVLLAAALVGGGLGGWLALGPSVGVLEIRGVIGDAGETIESLDRFRRDERTVAVVLRIDSPGGAVAPSQEIYDEVWRVRAQKPVIASLGNIAASGGYYVASAANVILADPGTITGSIGAIMGIQHYAALAEKIGVSEEIVKSGPFKDTGHPLRALRPEERALLQGMVDEVLGQFVDADARGREMEATRVRELADGRIYSGAQARAAGLVDRLGGLQEAIRLAWEEGGQSGEPRVSRVRARRRTWWLDLLGDFVAEPPAIGGGLLFLYRGPVPE
jgi:protease-4